MGHSCSWFLSSFLASLPGKGMFREVRGGCTNSGFQERQIPSVFLSRALNLSALGRLPVKVPLWEPARRQVTAKRLLLAAGLLDVVLPAALPISYSNQGMKMDANAGGWETTPLLSCWISQPASAAVTNGAGGNSAVFETGFVWLPHFDFKIPR